MNNKFGNNIPLVGVFEMQLLELNIVEARELYSIQ